MLYTEAPIIRALPSSSATPPGAMTVWADEARGDLHDHSRTRRVLVVEDNHDGLETLLALLDMLGYEVAGAGDGQEALDVARRFQPQVVLLDLGLPILDGLEVARTLRADPDLNHVFIAALTGWGSDSDRRRTAEAGFDIHLTKPVELATLQAALAKSGLSNH